MAGQSVEQTRVDQLATVMRKSEWQRVELAKIKRFRGYRYSRTLIRGLNNMCCANLYAQSGNQKSVCHGVAPGLRNRHKLLIRFKTDQEQQSEGFSVADARQTEVLESNELIFGSGRKLTKGALLSRAMLAVYLVGLVTLTVSTGYQYSCDLYNYHLERYRSAMKTVTESDATSETQEAATMANKTLNYYHRRNIDQAKLEQWLREERQRARVGGSFLLEHSIFAECCYILMMSLSFIIYLGPIIYFRFMGSHNFYPLRMQLDWDQEQMNCNLMIQGMVELVVESSRIFTLISVDELRRKRFGRSLTRPKRRQSCTPYSLTGVSAQPAILVSQHEPSDELVRMQETLFQMEHKWTVTKLKRMAVAGDLQPIDRRDADQVSRSMVLQALFILGSSQSCFFWNICLFTSMPYLFGFSYQWGLMDLLSMWNLYGMNVLLTLCGTFYFSQGLLYCRNQVVFVNGLRALVLEFMCLNQLVLRGLLASERQARLSKVPYQLLDPNDYDQLNSRLLLILSQYKLFLAQMRSTKDTFRYLLMSSMLIMTIFPLIARVHMPYLAGKNAKALTIIVCLILIGLPDFVILPLCWLNKRCLRLYQHLYMLIACLADSEAQVNRGINGNNATSISLYHEHTVWLLRRELNHPDIYKHQLAVKALGVELCYGEMLRLHFWVGLMIVTFCIDLQSTATYGGSISSGTLGLVSRVSSDSMFGNLFADPLGIRRYFDDVK